MSVTWAGQNTAVNLATTSSVGTGTSGTPVGPASGDLAGSYPGPTVDGLQGRPVASTAPTTGQAIVWSGTEWAPGTISPALPDADYGDIVVSSSGTVWTIENNAVTTAKIANHDVTYQKIQTCTAHHLLGRGSGNGTVQEIAATAFGQSLIDDADAAAARTTLGLGSTDTPTFAGINLASGEFISNSSNGRVDIGPDGIDPSSPAEDFMALTIDGTWGFGVFLGTRNTRTQTLNDGNILFQVPLILNNDTRFSFGSSQNYFIRHVSGSSRAGVAMGLLVNSAGSTGSLVIAQGNQVTAANRIPATAHADPTLYVYGNGNANANDFVRISHDTTDGTVEAGRGELRLKGASAVRIESSTGGFDLPATAGTSGQVLGTDGSNASWQSYALDRVVTITADVTNNNAVANTIQDVTGLEFPILNGKLYEFTFVCIYTAAATTTGSRWCVNASAGAATYLSMTSEYSLGSTTTTRNANIRAFDSPAASNATSSSTDNNFARMRGTIRATADATFRARFASEVASSAIVCKAGSFVRYRQVD
jgi:hypothetical protein